ncbi:hypothetical protein CHL67_08155 [Prosthecochloris sp. GSB1]|uniref:murein L,D-transpeptidase catalytic domain family protein n=1 Tax=Prosthecochloris sp. GSB1 TaxID=281093 RepID=UPI000B8C79CC|nr:murein L,D-transpeptidase catalytic domain family protein [Prosthecochloris sp. GSB1]ASQ90897.1 hypothetical protein CHL67_08155 [Prosthecochloris sp. GSB1]
MTARKTAAAITLSLLVTMLAIFLHLLWRPQVSGHAMREAFAAFETYRRNHPGETVRALAVVDYARPSYAKRMVIIDIATGERTAYRVAHGRNSGNLHAVSFSDEPGSNMSSLGLFRTGREYTGDHGLALRLHGLDSLKNANAFRRDIVLHSAWYVSVPVIVENILTLDGPRIGRSNGCFVVSPSSIDEVVGKLAEGSLLYAYGKTDEPFRRSNREWPP